MTSAPPSEPGPSTTAETTAGDGNEVGSSETGADGGGHLQPVAGLNEPSPGDGAGDSRPASQSDAPTTDTNPEAGGPSQTEANDVDPPESGANTGKAGADDGSPPDDRATRDRTGSHDAHVPAQTGDEDERTQKAANTSADTSSQDTSEPRPPAEGATPPSSVVADVAEDSTGAAAQAPSAEIQSPSADGELFVSLLNCIVVSHTMAMQAKK